MTAEVEVLRQVKEAEKHLEGQSPDYRQGFIAGAKFIVRHSEHKYDRPAEKPPDANPGGPEEF